MIYRREDPDGDYTFGQGDNTFLRNSPECVAQAVYTRLSLWRGEWFLNTTEGTPYLQSVLGKHSADIYQLAIRDRISQTPGIRAILSFNTNNNSDIRRLTFSTTLDTLYGTTEITSEA